MTTRAHESSEPSDEQLVRALRGEGIGVAFQPIVDLKRLVVAGYEALARFAEGGAPDRWFALAASRGVVGDLEAIVLERALAARPSLPADTFLTVNADPESLLADPVLARFEAARSLGGVVVEITEHRPMTDGSLARLELLRSHGALVAMDDTGAGYAGMQQILALRPSFLKLDRALVAGIDRDEAKVALVEMLGAFANRLDAWLIAEGVETKAEAIRLRELGVPLAQGYFFARPAPPWSNIDPSVATLRETDMPASRGSLRMLLETDERVLVDADGRPLGIRDGDAIRRALVANVHSSPREVAHRVSTRADASLPVIVTDNSGRYQGVVTIVRLLAALASG